MPSNSQTHAEVRIDFCIYSSTQKSLAYPIFFLNDTAATEIYTLSLHDALPICKDPTVNSTHDDHDQEKPPEGIFTT